MKLNAMLDGQSAQTMSVVRLVPDECRDGFKLLTCAMWFAAMDRDTRNLSWYMGS
jgi:hypothetical protein